MLLCAIAAISASGQGKTLVTVDMILPMKGMKSAYEAAWKNHMNKFHNTDDKRTVYEITSGANMGGYF